MCNLGSIFGSPDTSAASAATAQATTAANTALQQQLKATSDANSAADANSENDRLSSEAAMRRLAAGAMFGAGGAAQTVNNSAVFTRQAFGE
jgi:hypothetical protein